MSDSGAQRTYGVRIGVAFDPTATLAVHRGGGFARLMKRKWRASGDRVDAINWYA